MIEFKVASSRGKPRLKTWYVILKNADSVSNFPDGLSLADAEVLLGDHALVA